MPKGQKKLKGIPEIHNEVKKRVNLSLTPTAIAGLDKLSKSINLSRSELVEQIGRGLIPLVEQVSLSEEFAISFTQSLSLDNCERLPETMGAFLATDFTKFAYFGSSSNLKKRFRDKNFVKQLDEIKEKKYKLDSNFSRSDIHIIWIECNNRKAVPVLEQELLAQLRHWSISGVSSDLNKSTS
ncbi:MAG: hypothetical protein QNJ53_12950 [Pleurocapsa sp. MO_192.B19]|nr:hypothetical protein [Pleurocapsa sp. MO_192.B19]